jgi:hypothetical protein
MHDGQTKYAWPVEPGSALAGDDEASRPFQTSHASGRALVAALDHLHALVTLIVETRTIHVRAPYALARAALENASTALWLVAPKARRERVYRTLRLQVADAQDAQRASADLGGIVTMPLEERLEHLRSVAARNQINLDVRRVVSATEILTAADAMVKTDFAAGPLGAWRVFSGFSHGRPWADVAFSDSEREGHQSGAIKVTSRSSMNRVLYATSIAADVFDLAARTYGVRAASPVGR